MYRVNAYARLLFTGALLTCLCAGAHRARADWTDFLEMGLSEVPQIGSGFDFDDVPDFAPRGNYYQDNRYYRGGNRGRYGQPRPENIQTPPNAIPEAIINPAKNEPFSLTSYGLTAQQIAELKQGVRDDNRDALAKFASLLPNNDTLAKEIQTSSINETLHAQIFASARDGDVDTLRKMFLDTAVSGTPAEHESILRQAEARQTLSSVLASASAGTLAIADLNSLKTAMMPFMPTASGEPSPLALTRADELVNQLNRNSTMMNIFASATPGATTIAAGTETTIIVSPGFSPGTVVSLGPESAIVGATGPDADTIVGTGSVLLAAGAPIGNGEPIPDTTRKEITNGVYLRNNTGMSVNYILNGRYQYTMEGGEHQVLPGRSKWTIAFDRGGSHGEARYELSGSYCFKMTDNGWELFRETFDISIDNSSNTSEFHYVLNNEKHTAAAGESKDHNELVYPPFVRFDNGRGEVKTKALAEGRYQVLIKDNDRSWDLFAAMPQDTTPAATMQAFVKHDPLHVFAQPATTEDGDDFFGTSNVSDNAGRSLADGPSSNLFE